VSLRREREHVVVEMARLHVVNFSVEPDICVLLQHCRPDLLTNGLLSACNTYSLIITTQRFKLWSIY